MAIIAWTSVCIIITYTIINKTIGLRASREDELAGLDISEHGLPSAYADFAPSVQSYADDAPVVVTGDVPVAEAVPVEAVPEVAPAAPVNGVKLTKVEIICKERMFEALKSAMMNIGITGMTVTHVMGCGVQKGKPEYYRGVEVEPSLLPKIQVRS